MTTIVRDDEVGVGRDGAPGPAPEPGPRRHGSLARLDVGRIGRAALRWIAIAASTLAIFSAFLVAKGASPSEVLRAMWDTALGDAEGIGETLIRAVPYFLAGLATAIPARAGLFNIGAEGQLMLGAIGAAGMARLVPDSMPAPLALTLLIAGGAALGAAWAAIPAVLRLVCRMNEAIASLLLNYVAALIVAWLCFEPWKDPDSLGQAFTVELSANERLPILWGARVHAGILIALAIGIGCWLLLRSTTWGFKLKVLGGNPEAARRAGLAVGGLSVAAFVLGGAIGGIGGAIEVTGVEGRLRPEILAGYGYIGFLAAWLGRHHPLKVMGAAVLLGAISVGGSGLRIASGLSGGAVNILMALVLFAVLGWGRKPTEAPA